MRLSSNHGFVDGNKRTALIVTGLMIRRSGYRIALDDDERIDDIVVSVADGRMSFDELSLWMNARLVRT